MLNMNKTNNSLELHTSFDNDFMFSFTLKLKVWMHYQASRKPGQLIWIQ